MKIVIVDAATMNPGDLDWGEFQKLGAVTVYPRSSQDELLTRCRDAEVIVTNKAKITAGALSHLPELKFIAVTATGYDCIDASAAADRNILVSNVPEYSTQSVAQFVFSLILEYCHRVQLHAQAVADGDWCDCPDFSFTRSPQMELAGKTLGIIGYGRIGASVAAIANSFGMDICSTTRSGEKDTSLPVEFVPLDNLLRQADFISLHCPLTASTAQLVNSSFIEKCKTGAVLVNTSRGGLLDEQAVAEGLKSQKLSALLADVVGSEPMNTKNPLLKAPNCIITPHMAWTTCEARKRLMHETINNILAYQNGSPVNLVH